mmetsp:Transcript_10294/g.30522  ORF Transcript_10294/g.30522 Transcript_10294/m.30522 type:complete len:355 (+) Transcript_10294:126-1190(+)
MAPSSTAPRPAVAPAARRDSPRTLRVSARPAPSTRGHNPAGGLRQRGDERWARKPSRSAAAHLGSSRAASRAPPASCCSSSSAHASATAASRAAAPNPSAALLSCAHRTDRRPSSGAKPLLSAAHPCSPSSSVARAAMWKRACQIRSRSHGWQLRTLPLGGASQHAEKLYPGASLGSALAAAAAARMLAIHDCSAPQRRSLRMAPLEAIHCAPIWKMAERRNACRSASAPPSSTPAIWATCRCTHVRQCVLAPAPKTSSEKRESGRSDPMMEKPPRASSDAFWGEGHTLTPCAARLPPRARASLVFASCCCSSATQSGPPLVAGSRQCGCACVATSIGGSFSAGRLKRSPSTRR